MAQEGGQQAAAAEQVPEKPAAAAYPVAGVSPKPVEMPVVAAEASPQLADKAAGETAQDIAIVVWRDAIPKRKISMKCGRT